MMGAFVLMRLYPGLACAKVFLSIGMNSSPFECYGALPERLLP